MSTNWQEDVRKFHVACRHYQGLEPTVPPKEVKTLRFVLIKEEAEETLKAILADDLVGIADGIADTIVVLLGTAVSYGIEMQPIWDEVHKTNMAKEGGVKREDGKSLKPEGWKPPDVKSLLIKQGAEL